MNILDTFFFMFTADASGVQKGTEAGEASAKKLKKAVDDVDLSADKLAANFVNMAKNAAGALAGVLALGAIKTLVNDTAAHTAAAALQARALNMGVEQMSAYQAAIVSMGGDAHAAIETLGKLRDGFVEMSRFGVLATSPMTMAFLRLGASAEQMHAAIKDPTIALSAISDQFAKLDKTQQLYLGQKLGLDQGTIQLLSQGRRTFDEVIAKERELHAITQEQADASLKYTIAQKELGMSFEAVKREIAGELLPAFTWVVQHLDQMITWLREHKAVAVATFAAIGAAVGVALVPPLVAAAGAMWALIAPVLAAAAPFIALGLAIGLIVDDFEKYKAGQASVIGEIMKRWPAAGEIVKGVFDVLKGELFLFLNVLQGVWDYFAALLEFFATVISKGPIAALETLHQKTSAIFDKIGNSIKNVFGGLKEYGKGIADLWNQATGTPEGKKQIEAANANTVSATPTTAPATASVTPQQSPKAADAARLGNSASGREIADKLVASGKWTPEQAAGIAGSFMQESQGKANARNKSSGAYGLGQWLGTRVKDFEQWSGHALEGSSLDEQIAFFNYETSHKEKHAGDMIRRAQTATDAADAHAKFYERPGKNEINLERRERYANMIAAGQTQIAGTNTPLATSGAPVSAGVASRTTTVQVGDVHVHTQATEPKAVGQAVKDALKAHINSAIDHHDDGIAG